MKRLRMRPEGVVSKKSMGAASTEAHSRLYRVRVRVRFRARVRARARVRGRVRVSFRVRVRVRSRPVFTCKWLWQLS